MLISSILLGIAMLVINSMGKTCQSNKYCQSSQFLYNLSLFNILPLSSTITNTNNNILHNYTIQAILWLVYSVLLCVFFVYLRRYVYLTYKEIHSKNITQGDFCVILRRIKVPEDIQGVGVSGYVQRQIHKLMSNQISPEIDRMYPYLQKQNLSIQKIIILYDMEQSMQKLQKQHQRFKQAIKNDQYTQFILQQIPQPQIFSGTAIVIFKKIQTNDIIGKTIKISFLQKIIRYYFPFYSARSQFTINQQKISIQSAPEPTDINWNNIGYSYQEKIASKILFSVVSILVILFSAAVSFFMSLIKQKFYSNSKEGQINVTTFYPVIVFVFNKIIDAIFEIAMRKKKFDTKTSQYKAFISLLVFHQSVNLGLFSLFIPILVKLPNIEQGLLTSNFPQALVVSMLFKCFLSTTTSFLQTYFQIKMNIKKFLVKRGILTRTQEQANKQFKGPVIYFATKSSDFVQMFWFGIIFGIVSPLCIIITFFGVLLLHFYERVLFRFKYSIPEYTGIEIPLTIVGYLEFIVIHIGWINMVVYVILAQLNNSQIQKSILAISLTNLLLGTAFAILSSKIAQKQNLNIDSQLQHEQNLNTYNIHNFYPYSTYQALDPSINFVLSRCYRETLNLGLNGGAVRGGWGDRGWVGERGSTERNFRGLR